MASLTIPNSVNSIGGYAFYRCTYLSSITIPNSVRNIGDFAFGECSILSSVTIPNSVTSLGGSAFEGCTSLSGITIPDSITSMGTGVFAGCTSLTTVTIPGSITSIADSMFFGCFGLTSVTIPDSVTNIGEYAFSGCGLTNVTIPGSVTSIGSYVFNRCTNLTTIAVNATNPVYSSVVGVLFDNSQSTLLVWPAGKSGTYTIPNSVTTIASNAFYRCSGLTSIAIPNSVSTIWDAAFRYCTNLTGVYCYGNAPGYGLYVFDGDAQATVYYTSGTTGWGRTFAGRPAVQWNPPAQTSIASFGFRANQLGFTVTGTSGSVIVVEACTNLANPAWSPLATNTFVGGSSYFSDPRSSKYPLRFYRLRSP